MNHILYFNTLNDSYRKRQYQQIFFINKLHDCILYLLIFALRKWKDLI